MGIRILGGVLINEGPGKVGACLYQSTSNVVFGPVFDDTEAAQDFLDWFFREHGSHGRAQVYLVDHATRIFSEEYLPYLKMKDGEVAHA